MGFPYFLIFLIFMLATIICVWSWSLHRNILTAQLASARAVHNLLIAICDLFLGLEPISIVPPNLSEAKFTMSLSDQSLAYDSLENYLIDALLADLKEDQQTDLAQSFEYFAKLVSKLSEKVGDDECFSELEKQLKNISFKKNFSGVLQKHRASLKRHEERLRRTQSSGLESNR